MFDNLFSIVGPAFSAAILFTFVVVATIFVMVGMAKRSELEAAPLSHV
jgi:hypothetical protein